MQPNNTTLKSLFYLTYNWLYNLTNRADIQTELLLSSLS